MSKKIKNEFNASRRILDLTVFMAKSDQERYDEMQTILNDIYENEFTVKEIEIAKCLGLAKNEVNTTINLPKNLKVSRENDKLYFTFNTNLIAGFKPIAIALWLFVLALIGAFYAGYSYFSSDYRNCGAGLNKDLFNDGIRVINVTISDRCKPDINIDLNGNEKPYLNIDYHGNRMRVFNIDISGKGIPDYNLTDQYLGWREEKYGQDEYCLIILPNNEKCDSNCDTTSDGWPDLNIDLTGDGFPDVNIDTDCDNIADLNIDIDGDGKCDLRCDTDGDGKCDFRCTAPWPQLNLDIDNDNICDFNCNPDDDGICKYNCVPVVPGYPGTPKPISPPLTTTLTTTTTTGSLPTEPLQTLTLTFNANGGSGGTASRSCQTSEASCSINLNTVTKPKYSGYIFDGWSESTACIIKHTGSHIISTNKTLYACWKVKTTTTKAPSPETVIIEYVGGANINISGLLPDDQILEGPAVSVPTKEFAIKNYSNFNVVYSLRWAITQNTFTTNNLEYRIRGTMGGFNSEFNVLNPAPWQPLPKTTATATQKLIGQNIVILARSTHYYSIDIHLKGTGTVQNEDQGKSFGAYIEVLV